MAAKVGVIMGSNSDWETMKHACDILDELEVPYEKKVVSAHRTPDLMFEYAISARERGLQVIIAGAGGAAHLPGMVASKTELPVIGVPVKSSSLNGLDSLLSIVQMPGGIPVATVAIGNAGATNAGLLAAQILGINDPDLTARFLERRERLREHVLQMSETLGADA
jgi:5-(carboxyamino)imidazole ribonucleotide mutase